MSRGLRVLVPVSILVATAALVAAVIWQAETHPVGFPYVFGVGLVVLGAGVMTLRLTRSDDFLRRHFGEHMRPSWQSGWVPVLLGAAWLGLHYLDRWVQASQATFQFNTAFNRGAIATTAGDWQTADNAFSDAIRVAPPLDAEKARAYAWRGNARIHLKEYSQATDDFSEAIRLDPTKAMAYRGRGVAYLHQEEQDRALVDLSEAIRLDPNEASAWYNRGLAYSQKKDNDRALTDLGEAIRLKPGYTKAYLARSRVYAQKGDDARARADRQKAAELDRSLEESKRGGS